MNEAIIESCSICKHAADTDAVPQVVKNLITNREIQHLVWIYEEMEATYPKESDLHLSFLTSAHYLADICSLDHESVGPIFVGKTAGFLPFKSKSRKFLENPMVSFLLQLDESDHGHDSLIRKCDAIYRSMRKTHQIITDHSLIPFAMLMALHGASTDRMELYYNALRSNGFHNCRELECLTAILSLKDGDMPIATEELVRFRDAFENAGFPMCSDHNILFGLLMTLGIDSNALEDLFATFSIMKNTPVFSEFESYILLVGSTLILRNSDKTKLHSTDIEPESVLCLLHYLVRDEEATICMNDML